jgi:hypothetical protein
MKLFIHSVFAFVFFLPFALYAQTDILNVPTEAEKNEVMRILKEYEKFMNATGDSSLPKEKKALAALKFSKEIFNNDIQVYVDLDSAADNFIKIFSYAQKLKDLYPQTVTTTLSEITLSKVKFDKLRKYHFIEASADKKTEWYKLQAKTIRDTLTSIDSTLNDTLRYGFSKKITFYIRFDKVNSLSRNFKLFAISKAGAEPKLEPLSPLVLWWLEMDTEWKSFFKERFKFEEYPSAYDIEKITGLGELDISNRKFTTLEPLRKMVFMQNLNCSNTQVSSLEPISGLYDLSVLNISKTQIKDLKGIEKLINLTELYCPKLGIESMEPVKNLTGLLKLDFSENEVEDISFLQNLINLKELNFSLNIKIKTIEPVRNLVALEKLSFGKIDARTLEPLKNLTNLIHLDCFNTNISTLEPIRNHQKIIWLTFDHNSITSLDPIKDYKFITYLSLSSTGVSDLSLIKNYQYLRELNISNNPLILTLGPVMKLEYIRELKCFYTKISKEEVARFKKSHPGCDITYYY